MDDPYAQQLLGQIRELQDEVAALHATQQRRAHEEAEERERLLSLITTRFDRVDDAHRRIEDRQEAVEKVTRVAWRHGADTAKDGDVSSGTADPPLQPAGDRSHVAQCARVCTAAAAVTIAVLLALQVGDDARPGSRVAEEPLGHGVSREAVRPGPSQSPLRGAPEPVETGRYMAAGDSGRWGTGVRDDSPGGGGMVAPSRPPSTTAPAEPLADGQTTMSEDCERRLLAVRRTQICRSPASN